MPRAYHRKPPIVDHLSYSAVRSFMVSPNKFHKSYVLRERMLGSMSMAAGKAWHKALEYHYRGMEYKQAIKQAKEYLMTEAIQTRGDLTEEDVLNEVHLLGENFKLYLSRERSWKPKYIEESIIIPSPVRYGLPIKCVMDIVDMDNNIIDHKYIGARNKKPDTQYYMQAWFYYHAVKELTGFYPEKFIAAEFIRGSLASCKKENAAIDKYTEKVILYNKEWISKIDEWYGKFCIQLRKQKEFLPNPFQLYDYEEWDQYLGLERETIPTKDEE